MSAAEDKKTCDPELLERALAGKKRVKVEWVEGPEHFRKAGGRKDTDVFDDVNKIVLEWCKEVMGEGGKGDAENGAEKEKKSEGKKRKSGDMKEEVESKKAKEDE